MNELKAMLIHVLLNYDVKFRDETAGFPRRRIRAGFSLPNQNAKVMFRRRKAP